MFVIKITNNTKETINLIEDSALFSCIGKSRIDGLIMYRLDDVINDRLLKIDKILKTNRYEKYHNEVQAVMDKIRTNVMLISNFEYCMY